MIPKTAAGLSYICGTNHTLLRMWQVIPHRADSVGARKQEKGRRGIKEAAALRLFTSDECSDKRQELDASFNLFRSPQGGRQIGWFLLAFKTKLPRLEVY
ncbi:hypothetical protein E2C01_012748 [Portunus trituberculatus]|uniref:Uncharacterized protein n=1 Tax=Portunus trituberculatus TaxID=210409 RepID=A0A5B7DEP8_PORTR|nr:hypothetical protein [Portunus trituberculatus]